MSNERIEHLLDVYGVRIEGDMRQWIRNAMEQYGKEQYSEGYNAAYIEDGRLRSLVQAQKELIEMYQISVTDWVPDHILRRINNLRNKIKSLEA